MTVAWDRCPERVLGGVNEALQGSELVEFGQGNGPILLLVGCVNEFMFIGVYASEKDRRRINRSSPERDGSMNRRTLLTHHF